MLIRKKLLGLFVVSTLSMAMVQAETVTQEVMIVGEDSVSAEVADTSDEDSANAKKGIPVTRSNVHTRMHVNRFTIANPLKHVND